MHYHLTRSLVKLGTFFVILALVIIGVRKATDRKMGDSDYFNKFYLPAKPTKKNAYFIGSSRTRNSVNDSLLNAQFPQINFLNAGMGYGTFLSSTIIANKIMQRAPGSIIFVELSLANSRIPKRFSLIASPAETLSNIWHCAYDAPISDWHKVYIPFIENYVYGFLYLKPHVKLLSGQASLNNYFGWTKRMETMNHVPTTFIHAKDFEDSGMSVNKIPTVYYRMIHQLLRKANATKSTVLFYLPICMDKDFERNRVLAVFNTIPKTNTMVYTNTFLSEICTSQNVADSIHLNVRGANIFTNNILDFISKRNNLLCR